MNLINLAKFRMKVNTKITSVLVSLLLYGYSTTFAQQDYPENVKNLFSAVDSLKRNNQPEEGIILLDSWLEKVNEREDDNDFILGEVQYTLADLLKFSNRNRESIASALRAADYYKNSELTALMADCYSLIGDNHIYLGNYEIGRAHV